MTVFEKIQDYNVKKAELLKEANAIKKEFEKYISDKKIPLLERLEVYRQADDEFKNHSRWIISGKSKGMKYVLENYFDAPEVYGRGKRINLCDVFEELWDEEGFYPENFTYKMDKEEAEKLMYEALEEMLSYNIGTFCFDW